MTAPEQPGTAPPPGIPGPVGVLGGGRMGAGIAHAFLLAGSDVVVVERDEHEAAAAAGRVHEALVRSVERGTTERPLSALRASLSVASDIEALTDAGLVVEAVPEDRDLKQAALARLGSLLPPQAVLASNTSSIPIDTLARALQHPSRFLGLHFFNPVPTSALVEVVRGTATAPALVEAAAGWVATLGKRAVVVRDSPGFASSRLGVLLGLEAIRMLEEGVADAADIDAAMELGYRHPMGPLRTSDIVGLDVRLGIAEQLADDLGPRFTPPDLLRRLVAEGHLGRKTGRGFYTWNEGR